MIRSPNEDMECVDCLRAVTGLSFIKRDFTQAKRAGGEDLQGEATGEQRVSEAAAALSLMCSVHCRLHCNDFMCKRHTIQSTVNTSSNAVFAA